MFGALQVGMKLHAMYGADGKYYPSEVVALAKRKNPAPWAKMREFNKSCGGTTKIA